VDLPVIDPDAIAKALEEGDSLVRAARASILRCRELLDARKSFVLETTLAGNGALALMRQAKQAGYWVLLIYVALADAELHIERVRLRVSLGGHDVPDSDIRRRFTRSLSRVPQAIRLADEAVLIDNSDTHPQRVLILRNGEIAWHATPLPRWVERVIAQLSR
jgi:predicted ABC-type ATPase